MGCGRPLLAATPPRSVITDRLPELYPSATAAATPAAQPMVAAPRAWDSLRLASVATLVSTVGTGILAFDAMSASNVFISCPNRVIEGVILLVKLASVIGMLCGGWTFRHAQHRTSALIVVLLNLFALLFASPPSGGSNIFMALIAISGAFCALAGLVVLLIESFRASTTWGLVSLFVPLGFIVFAVAQWQRARQSSILFGGGLMLILITAPFIFSHRF